MKLTGWLLCTIFASLLTLDAFLPGMGQPTESQWLRDTAWDWNTVPFIAGFLIGHWFGNRYVVSYSAWGYALGFLVAELLLDCYWQIKHPGVYPLFRYPLFHALAAIPVGMFLWGQSFSSAPNL